MNVLSTKLHGVLDYVTALLLICMPWLMGFEQSAIEGWLGVGLGCGSLLYSLCTDYELGFLEELDMRTHLLLDFLLGVVLTVSPWLLGFYDKVYLPYPILGIIVITSTFLTRIDGQNFSKTSS